MAMTKQLKTEKEVTDALQGNLSDNYLVDLAKLRRIRCACTQEVWQKAAKKE